MTKEEFIEGMKELKKEEDKNYNKNKIVDWLFRSLLGILVYFGSSMHSSLEEVKKDVSTIITQRSYSEKDILNNTLELEKRNDIIYGNRDDIIIIKEQIKGIEKKIKMVAAQNLKKN